MISKQEISKLLCGYELGDKLPTYNELHKMLGFGTGTIQAAIDELVLEGAIKFENKGMHGRILTVINYDKLISNTGLTNLIGIMPLPYSKQYEGLATGIFASLNKGFLDANLAFMSGSENRLKVLLNGRYDFMVVSHLTAMKMVSNHPELEIVKILKEESFMKNHIFITHKNVDEIFDGIKIGVDFSSSDQLQVTFDFFEEKNINIVPIRYSNLADSIKQNIIDGAVWSVDNVQIDKDHMKVYKTIQRSEAKDETKAAIVTLKDNVHVQSYLKRHIDERLIEEKQKRIIAGEEVAYY